MLKVDNIKVSYGQVKALLGVSIDMNDGEVVSIIGSNGAGKSSLMRAIMGDVRVSAGRITYGELDLLKRKTHQVVADGIVYVPEGRQVFTKLTVQENLEMGAFSRNYTRSQLGEQYEEAYEMFPILKEKRRQYAGSLSGGQQQMLALCRGLMSRPKLMMLDEPSLGLAPNIVDEVFEKIKDINKKRGISILLVEQNAYMALEASSRCFVLENGQIKLSGESRVLIHDPQVKAAYLGA